MSKRVRLGIIGCGIAAQRFHVSSLQALNKKFQVKIACDTDLSKARQVAKAFGDIPFVSDYEEVLSRTDIDAVDLALPIQIHYEVSKRAIAAGKHVLVEKPIAGNLKQAAELVDLSRQSRKVLMVAENFRFRPNYYKVRELVRSGKIGQPHLAIWEIHQYLNKNHPYTKTLWRFEPGYSGGFVTDRGVHYIAALRLIFGDVSFLHSTARGIKPLIGKVDTVLLRVRCGDHVEGVVTFCLSANKFIGDELRIFGSEGTIIVKHKKKSTLVFCQSGTSRERFVLRDDGGYCAEFDAFHQAIVGTSADNNSCQDAFNDLDIILKAIRIQN